MTSDHDSVESRILDAALMHVPFDGWSETSFRAGVADAGVDPTVARALLPRGALDLAMLYHRRGDDEMVRRLKEAELDGMRFRDRIALAVRLRLESIDDREAVRRASTLFALPMHAADGARLIWGTADRIWAALGDSSEDVNWYTKRATLSGVYSATLLYWLGDDSLEHGASWEFCRSNAAASKPDDAPGDHQTDQLRRPYRGIKLEDMRGHTALKRTPRAKEGSALSLWQFHAPKPVPAAACSLGCRGKPSALSRKRQTPEAVARGSS